MKEHKMATGKWADIGQGDYIGLSDVAIQKTIFVRKENFLDRVAGQEAGCVLVSGGWQKQR